MIMAEIIKTQGETLVQQRGSAWFRVPPRGASGPILAKLHRDLPERKRADAALKPALAEKEAPIRELYHRTKNNMQVVSALLANRGAEAPEEARRTYLAMGGRIRAMALVHGMLYSSNALSSLDFADNARRLLGLAGSSFGTAEGSGPGSAPTSTPSRWSS